jgi:type II secretory pathway component PulC
MAALPAEASPRTSDTLLLAALVVVLAWQLAYWTWRFVAPPQLAPAAASSAADVDLDLVARLFGASHGGANAGSLRLKGVVAPTPGTVAAAIFAGPNGRDVAVLPGGDVASGVKLAEVFPDHVIVTRNGVRERIDLDVPRPGKALASANGPAARGFHLDVTRTGQNDFAFARRDLDEALRDPGQLNYLGQIGVAPGGGVQLNAAPAGSLASRLGLQSGDVIRRVNGQSIGSQGDLARLYQQFATTNTIQAEIERGGQVVKQTYRIQ